MAWFFDPREAINWAKEAIYGPTHMCEKNDFLCQWTNGQHVLADLPSNLMYLPISSQFLNPLVTGGVLAGLSLVGIHPLAAKGAYWLYRASNAGIQAHQVSAEAGWLSMNYLVANVAGFCTGRPNLAFLAACAVDLSYKAYAHPEQCIGAAANMVIGYVAFDLGDKAVKFLFEPAAEVAQEPPSPEKKTRKRRKR